MRKTMLLLLAGLLAALLMLPAAVLAQSKIGYVDLSRTLELTDLGKKIQKDLAARRDEIEFKIKEMEVNLLGLKDQYNKKKDGLSDDAIRGMEREMQQKGMEYQGLLQNSQIEFEKFKLDQLKGFIGKVEELTSSMAKTEGFTMVLLKVEDFLTGSSVVLYGDKNHDLTDKIIKRLNESSQP